MTWSSWCPGPIWKLSRSPPGATSLAQDAPITRKCQVIFELCVKNQGQRSSTRTQVAPSIFVTWLGSYPCMILYHHALVLWKRLLSKCWKNVSIVKQIEIVNITWFHQKSLWVLGRYQACSGGKEFNKVPLFAWKFHTNQWQQILLFVLQVTGSLYFWENVYQTLKSE